MAVLKNNELEILNKISNILTVNTEGFSDMYLKLSEEKKTDIVLFNQLIGKLENDRDMQRIRTKTAIREKRKINKAYGRKNQA